MRISPRAALVLYLAAMVVTLPYLPSLVTFMETRVGREAVFTPLYGGLAAAALLPVLRLFRPPRPRPPWPHVTYALLVLAALVMAATLASSPIGRVHLAEYGLLAVLTARALPGRRPALRYGGAFLLTSLVGLADEIVQHFLPTRVFDWYDVALNVGASLLGVLALAWWTLAGAAVRATGPGSGAGAVREPAGGSG